MPMNSATDDRSILDRALPWAFAPLVALLVLLLCNSSVRAAAFDVHYGDDLNIVVVTEEILPGDDDAFQRAIKDATHGGRHAMVVLASPGGALGAGMHMGLMIAEAGLPTFVPEGEVCASACALAWLAGAPRMMAGTSEIGFHQPYDERDGEMIPSIEANAVVGHYIATIGMGPAVVSFAVSSPPDRMSWLDLATAHEIGLNVTEVEPSGAMALAPVGTEGVDRRAAPTDENAVAVASVPLPVMRPLTAHEVASVELTGATDGAAELGQVFPTTSAAGEPVSGGVTRVAATDWDEPLRPSIPNEGLPAAAGVPHFDDMTGGEAGTSLRVVERAVMETIRDYGLGGGAALRRASAACWRDMREGPNLEALQFCHVVDLVGQALAEPGMKDFDEFAVVVRLRAHRMLLDESVAMPADFAATWGAETEMVVAAMTDG